MSHLDDILSWYSQNNTSLCPKTPLFAKQHSLFGQLVYERAVAAFPVTAFLWQQYARYCESTIKIHDVTLAVYQRAVCNCPWHGALWGRLLTAMERSGESQDRQQATYNKALQAGLQVGWVITVTQGGGVFVMRCLCTQHHCVCTTCRNTRTQRHHKPCNTTLQHHLVPTTTLTHRLVIPPCTTTTLYQPPPCHTTTIHRAWRT